jgi:hypothetical protein
VKSIYLYYKRCWKWCPCLYRLNKLKFALWINRTPVIILGGSMDHLHCHELTAKISHRN